MILDDTPCLAYLHPHAILTVAFLKNKIHVQMNIFYRAARSISKKKYASNFAFTIRASFARSETGTKYHRAQINRLLGNNSVREDLPQSRGEQADRRRQFGPVQLLRMRLAAAHAAT